MLLLIPKFSTSACRYCPSALSWNAVLSFCPFPIARTVYGGTSGLLSTSIASPAARIADSDVSRCPLIATASAPDSHSPLTTRCMSRSRTRPVSEKPLLSRGPPPPVSVPLASSTTSRTPGPCTGVAPESSPTSSAWSPPYSWSACRCRSPTSARIRSMSCSRPSAPDDSASIRSISSCRSLATIGAETRASAPPTVTTAAARSRPAATPSFARTLRGVPPPSAARRAVASAYPSSRAWSITLFSSDMDASGRGGGDPVLRTGGCCDMPHIVARRAAYRRMAPPSGGEAPLGHLPAGRVDRVSCLRCRPPRPTRRAGPARRCRRDLPPTDG